MMFWIDAFNRKTSLKRHLAMTPEKSSPDQPATFAPPRAGRWFEVLLRYRYAAVIALVFVLMLGQKAIAQEFKSAADCVVGKRVMTREQQAGVIVKADGSSCHVKLDSTGKIDYNIFWMLRAETAAGKPGQASSPSNTTGNLAPGKYPCYMLAGSTLNYMFIDIHIESNNRYRDGSGKTGTYTVGANDSISFTGPLASAKGKLLPGPRIGLNMNGGNFYNTTCSRSK